MRTEAWRLVRCEGQPETREDHVVYLVGSPAWVAVFSCPCGCQAFCALPLYPGASPKWAVTVEPGELVTLAPSVNRLVGCRSHFWIQRGRTAWA